MRKARANGAVLYEGPSLIDGHPIVAIVTGLTRPSANTKTGWMIQTWIFRADMNPFKAIHRGEDFSVCGSCPARGKIINNRNKGRFCYVNVAKAGCMVWNAWQRGTYSADLGEVADIARVRSARLGAYGEPTAIPPEAWAPLLTSTRRTGYTHRWRVVDTSWRKLLMASVDTPEERKEAKAAGWRTFRIRLPEEKLLRGEIICPASEEAGYKTQCERCGLCRGGKGKDVAIIAHGAYAKSYRRWREQR